MPIAQGSDGKRLTPRTCRQRLPAGVAIGPFARKARPRSGNQQENPVSPYTITDRVDRENCPPRRQRIGEAARAAARLETACGWPNLWVPRTVSRSLISAFVAADLDIAVQRQPRMIAYCGFRTRLSDACSRAGLA